MNGYRTPIVRRGYRLTALIAVIVGVLAVAAAAFVLSYPGARDTALAGGVTTSFARIYPVIFDAMLIVACAAAFALQGARWWLRGYAWLVLLVIIASVAAADTVHATAVKVPKRPLEATVAIVPWAVLLIGFTLLYAMARQYRRTTQASFNRRASAAAIAAEPAAIAATAELVPEGAATAEPATVPALEPGLPAADASGSGASEEHPTSTGMTPLSALLSGRPDQVGQPVHPAPAGSQPEPAADPAVTAEELPELPVRIHDRDEPSDADAEPAPHFTRLRSTPTPPGDYGG
ncbi:MAG TPA: DUF2637 domain-containing protein [Streptosporangiaceae bacterium]